MGLVQADESPEDFFRDVRERVCPTIFPKVPPEERSDEDDDEAPGLCFPSRQEGTTRSCLPLERTTLRRRTLERVARAR